MGLCLPDSLLSVRGFDPVDQMTRYRRWMRDGYMSSNGVCLDIGNATREAILQFERSGEGYCGSESPMAAGNGSIMRLAPVPMFFATDPASAIRYAALSSRTTHGAEECVDVCRFFAALIVEALTGWSKEELLECAPFVEWVNGDTLAPRVEEIRQGSYRKLEPPDIQGSGYVIKSLEAALWAFYKSSSFEEGALLAVNLGDDADTTGAVYGQLAGAYYGMDKIPARWVNKLAKRDVIQSLADGLYRNKQ